jgi:hypothetical protein
MTTLSIKKVNKGIKDFNLKNKNKKILLLLENPLLFTTQMII